MNVSESTMVSMVLLATAYMGIAWNRSNVVENSTDIKVLQGEVNGMKEPLGELNTVIQAMNQMQEQFRQLHQYVQSLSPVQMPPLEASSAVKPQEATPKERKYTRLTNRRESNSEASAAEDEDTIDKYIEEI